MSEIIKNSLFNGKKVIHERISPDKPMEVIGLYLDEKPTSANYGKFSFAIREVNGNGKHSTSWWFTDKKINENIHFIDEETDRYYRSSDFLNYCKEVKEKLINSISNNENETDSKVTIDKNLLMRAFYYLLYYSHENSGDLVDLAYPVIVKDINDISKVIGITKEETERLSDLSLNQFSPLFDSVIYSKDFYNKNLNELEKYYINLFGEDFTENGNIFKEEIYHRLNNVEGKSIFTNEED